VDLRIVPLDRLFLSRLDPEDGGVVFSVLPHIIEYQLRLARSTRTLACEDAGIDRILNPIVWLFFDLPVQVGTGRIIEDRSKSGVSVVTGSVCVARLLSLAGLLTLCHERRHVSRVLLEQYVQTSRLVRRSAASLIGWRCGRGWRCGPCCHRNARTVKNHITSAYNCVGTNQHRTSLAVKFVSELVDLWIIGGFHFGRWIRVALSLMRSTCQF
jgi:hypothetical protein